jgi:hypothetical protein
MRVKACLVVCIVVLALWLTGCNLPGGEETGVGEDATLSPADTSTTGGGPASPPTLPANIPTDLLNPQDITYLGAFRLPDDGDYEHGWLWSGQALTYYPGGDPGGGDDGFPGSLFGTGHNVHQWVSEISIPAPVLSAAKNVAELPIAITLQPFQNIRGDFFDNMTFELPRAGLEYLPPIGDQTSGKLHFCWGEHMQWDLIGGSHGFAELDLSNPQPVGAWYIGDYPYYSVNDYLFAIPAEWTAANAPGMVLATGRYRDGGWSGMGPSLYAYTPLVNGSPAPSNAHLEAIQLLQYAASDMDWEGPRMNNYSDADEWTGGAWITAGSKAAVAFVGVKGLGDTWYGFSNGVVWPEEGPWPEIPAPPHNERGWWNANWQPQIIFYSPNDLAAVARGELQPFEPQPYAAFDLTPYMFHIETLHVWSQVGAVAYDRAHNYLFIMELFVDGEQPIIHIFQVNG